ncbi:MAG: hydantoinase/oxoprolinase family protein [bacterium]|nr:hydantoinase/oxoprolinase family protein [bacterium]
MTAAKRASRSGIRIGVDVGGTYTDLVLIEERGQNLAVEKVSSTPGSAASTIDGIRKLTAATGVPADSIDLIVHGSTIATNACLTRRGARVALVVTEGFRDVLEIRNQLRPHLYRLTQTKPAAVVPRRRIVEARERIDAFGDVVEPLRERSAENVVAGLRALDPDAVGVCLTFAHLNDTHERIVAERIRSSLETTPVYLSSLINPQIEEFPRANTTAMAAFVGPVVEAYLDDLMARLESLDCPSPVLYLRSDGGVATSRAIRDNPALLLLSGPAGGVIAATHVADKTEIGDFVTFDMGGTSADFSIVVNGEPATVSQRMIDGQPLRQPMIDIETISAGGGSIARVDVAGGLRVGPDSAGAEPGPACHARGGELPTVTDAAVVLGIIDPAAFLGGEQAVDACLAREAVERHVARPLGIDVEPAALGIMAVANAQMARAIRALSAERGLDLRRFALLAFGGAGPMCASSIAASLGMREVLVPPNPGVFAALGMLMSDIRHTLQRPYHAAVDALDADDLARTITGMKGHIDGMLERDGIASDDRCFRYVADCRCIGQFHELAVTLDVTCRADWWNPAEFAASFHQVHRARYGHTDASVPVELVNLRLEGRGRVPLPRLPGLDAADREDPEPTDRRPVWLDRATGAVECAVYERSRLGAGHRVKGPAIVRQDDSTIVVLAGQQALTTADGLLRILLG